MASGQQECQFSHSTPEGMNTTLPQQKQFYLKYHAGLILVRFPPSLFNLGESRRRAHVLIGGTDH